MRDAGGYAATPDEPRRVDRRRRTVAPHEELLANVAVQEADVPRDLPQPVKVCPTGQHSGDGLIALRSQNYPEFGPEFPPKLLYKSTLL